VISDAVSNDISLFGRIVHANGTGLANSLSVKDMEQLVRQAFGKTLASIDLAHAADKNREALLGGVSAFLDDALTQSRSDRSFVFGCWLIRDVPIDVQIGAVKIEPRKEWLARMRGDGRITATTARRLLQHWSGARLRPRKPSYDGTWERELRESIGACPDVCTVDTRGMASNVAEDKAILAARLAITAIALLWRRPSKALEGFGLLLDGGWVRRHHVVYDAHGWRGSATRTTRLPGTTWVVADDWEPVWDSAEWLLGPVGQALQAFLTASEAPPKPNVTRALIHALWWFFEACKAESPLMATVKFAAVLDTLAGGGGDRDILKLIKARLGRSPDDSITRDGRRTAAVVREIYGAGRSKTIHGSNEQFGHDWSSTRDLAESLTRNCLVEAIGWLHANSASDDLSKLKA
jgi:hypothetical protein